MSALYPRLKDGHQKRVVDGNVALIREVISNEKKVLGRLVNNPKRFRIEHMRNIK